ncbi:Solute carrier 2, facilitated glucose transporter member 4 [Sparganum proliferum]
MSSLIIAAFPIGGVFGALIGSPMSNKMGRKLSLFILNVPMAAGSLLMMCSAFTGIAPVYLAEIAPVNIRGAAGIVNQLAIVIALLISQIFGLTEVMGTATLWPYLLGLTIIPSIVLLLLLWTCPDSPRYILLNRLNEESAKTALRWYRGPNVNIDEELEELLKEHVDSGRQKFTLINLFKTPHLRAAILIAIVAHLSQQFSGINAALFYSTAVFLYINFTASQAAYATLGVGGMMVLVTLISIFLIERFGRRKLLIPGLSVMFFCTILITIGLAVRHSSPNVVYLAIASIYLFVGGFAIGPGSIPWFIVAEMFVQENRDAAILVTVLVNWISQIIVSLGYMQLLNYLNDYSFVPFTVLLAIFIILLYRYLPETSGRNPREVEEDFIKRTGRGLPSVGSPYVEEVDGRHDKSSEALVRGR